MVNKLNILDTIFQGILFFFLFESFSNMMVNTNAHIFMNLSRMSIILPTILILVIGIIIEIVFFYKNFIESNFKPFFLVILISILRILSQFIILPSMIMIFNFFLFFSVVLLIIEFTHLIEILENKFHLSTFLFGIPIGITIQLIFLTLNVSNNLTSATLKIIPIFGIVTYLLIINWYFYHPKIIQKYKPKEKINNNNPVKQEISFFHFIIYGILFILSLLWIFNPIALSAYDVLDRSFIGLIPDTPINWISYGFTYYILLIGIAILFSSIISHYLLFSKPPNYIKKLIIIISITSCILNVLAYFIIEQPIVGLSSFYITILVVFNVFSITLYVFYCFSYYSFQNRKKSYLGLIIFFFTCFFFIILQVQILWYEYLSLLLNNIIILSLTGTILIILIELKNGKLNLKRKELQWDGKKPITVVYVIIFVILISSFGIVILQRSSEPKPKENPTFMIWNIHNAIGVDDIFDPQRIVEEIEINNPDVIGLNEVDLGALKTSFVDLTSYFAHKLNMYYFYGYSFYKHYGNALLSKYPIQSAEIIHLPQAKSSTEPRSMIKAELEINNEIWTVFITHLSTNQEDRLVQVPYILSVLELLGNFDNVIWMGDFNLEPSSEEYKIIARSNIDLIDSYKYLHPLDPGYTCHFDENFTPRKRIDYILSSPDVIPRSSTIYCSLASDHCAVITEFT